MGHIAHTARHRDTKAVAEEVCGMDAIVYEDREGNVIEEEVERLRYDDEEHSWHWNFDRDESAEPTTFKRKKIPRERVFEIVEEREVTSPVSDIH
jgi:hypothetical protein